MNRNQLLLISLAGACLLAITATQMVWSKAHVPIGKVQMCHKGRTAINVGAPAQFAHLRHGDFFLPACDFNNVFRAGDDCSGVDNRDGFAVFGDRDDAGGVTDACPVGTF